MKLTIFCGPYPVDEHLGGIGLRLWELAQVLAGDGHHLTMVVPRHSTWSWPGISLRLHANDKWAELVETSDAIITTDLPDTRILLHAHRCGVLTIAENAPPIEHLHYAAIRDAADPAARYDDVTGRYLLQLLLADHLLVRSSVERASTLGALAAIGRLSPAQHERHPALGHLITLMPVGYNRFSAARADVDAAPDAGSCGPATDLVWNGGVWDYSDPGAVLMALAHLRDAGTPLTLRFLYPPPADQRLLEAQRLPALAEQLGVRDLVHLPTRAIPHSQRDTVLNSARAIVCIGRDSSESHTCHRLRLRDAFLYRLPIVIDHHGASADLVRTHKIGYTTDPNHPADLAQTLLAAVRDGPPRAALCSALEKTRDRFTFEANLGNLRAFLADRTHAPDIGTPKHSQSIARFLAEHPSYADDPGPTLL